MMAGSGSYSRLDLQWDVAISSRGTAAIIDGHTLLITPLRWVVRRTLSAAAALLYARRAACCTTVYRQGRTAGAECAGGVAA
jgi:hypothetical protein